MFNKVVRFYQGRVYIKGRGEKITNFINEALRDNIAFYNTRRLEDSFSAEIDIRDFSRLRRAARLTGVEIKIKAKYGLPFLAVRWKKRKGLLVGLFIIFAALTILSQLVLSISVEGNNKVSANTIIEEADKLGIKRWVLKNQLDYDDLSEKLQERISDIVWVSIEDRGTNLKIKVVEKTLPIKEMIEGDLIAAKEGLVQEIMVIQGEPQVHEGQLVREGQVLIKATGGMKEYTFDISDQQQDGSKEEVTSVPVAKGFVRGRVWYNEEVRVPLIENVEEKSGRASNGWGIKINNRVIMITNQKSPYEKSMKQTETYQLPSWRNWNFPVEVIKVHYQELQSRQIKRTVYEAREYGEKLAKEKLMERIPTDAEIMKEKVRIIGTGKGVEHIRFEIETFEELAVYKQ